MCGRYLLMSSGELLLETFHLLTAPVLTPRYNIAPGQHAPVIRSAGDDRTVAMLRWGLLPHWSRFGDTVNRMINARSETADSKPSFRAAFRERRCIVPADGFFEWTGPRGRKQPFLLRPMDGRPIAFAGLWESWSGPTDQVPWVLTEHDHPHDDGTATIETFTILTTTPNETVAPIHDRMPVILDAAGIDAWLAPGESPDASVLAPCPSERIEAVPVSTRINNVRNDDPECLDPPTRRPRQHRLFDE